MSRNLTWAAVIAIGLLAGMKAIAADRAPAPASASAAKPADKLSRVLDGIRAIDTKAKTITLGGFGGADQTFSYNGHTRFMQDIPAAVSDIKVGDTLRAITMGAGVADAKSISPNFLNIVPPVDVNGPPFPGPFTPVEGVVTTLAPLAITADKKTITINIAHDTLLSKSTAATVADVKTGMFGSAIVRGDGADRVLTELHIIRRPGSK